MSSILFSSSLIVASRHHCPVVVSPIPICSVRVSSLLCHIMPHLPISKLLCSCLRIRIISSHFFVSLILLSYRIFSSLLVTYHRVSHVVLFIIFSALLLIYSRIVSSLLFTYLIISHLLLSTCLLSSTSYRRAHHFAASLSYSLRYLCSFMQTLYGNHILFSTLLPNYHQFSSLMLATHTYFCCYLHFPLTKTLTRAKAITIPGWESQCLEVKCMKAYSSFMKGMRGK